jgi:hypothetical protein
MRREGVREGERKRRQRYGREGKGDVCIHPSGGSEALVKIAVCQFLY